jgi:hypothetical protein
LREQTLAAPSAFLPAQWRFCAAGPRSVWTVGLFFNKRETMPIWREWNRKGGSGEPGGDAPFHERPLVAQAACRRHCASSAISVRRIGTGSRPTSRTVMRTASEIPKFPCVKTRAANRIHGSRPGGRAPAGGEPLVGQYPTYPCPSGVRLSHGLG